jgi:hypothetical protein
MCGTQSRETQTDHIQGGRGFANWNEFTEWAKMILWVSFDDIRELCKSCHETVTLSQKLGVNLDEAYVQKQVIAIQKTKAAGVIAWLQERGITPGKNAKERKQQLTEQLRKEKNAN